LHVGGEPVLLKHRFSKQYRHAALDGSLTRARVAGEARAILRSLRCGVSVPGVRFVDAANGVLGIEWVNGKSVRCLLGSRDEEDESEDGDENEARADEDPLGEYAISKDAMMKMVGTEIAKMHLADIIHGDLTTSNMMLRHPSFITDSRPGTQQLVLIDFGLAYTSALAEDKAVDLYVLERAFASTHPESEPLFERVVEGYKKKIGLDWTAIGRRLEEVRLRGRKRSMIG